MTHDLVGRLRALREAANSGTWMQVVADNSELLAQMEEDAGKVEDRVAGLIYTREGGAHGKGVTLATINARRSTIERDQANAELIVEAVNALPTLIARIEALEAAIRTIMARCEAIEDEAAVGLAKDNTPHAEGFQRGEKYTAKSIRRHLHDLTRAALTPEPPHAD